MAAPPPPPHTHRGHARLLSQVSFFKDSFVIDEKRLFMPLEQMRWRIRCRMKQEEEDTDKHT